MFPYDPSKNSALPPPAPFSSLSRRLFLAPPASSLLHLGLQGLGLRVMLMLLITLRVKVPHTHIIYDQSNTYHDDFYLQTPVSGLVEPLELYSHLTKALAYPIYTRIYIYKINL